MSMNVDQARTIYNQYVQFAQQELEKAGGDIKRADGVANFVDGQVLLSETDKIHHWWRGSAERANNRNVREKFFESIEKLLGKDAVERLQAHIKSEINHGVDSGRPLSARRIILISREVDLALAAAGRDPSIANGVKLCGARIKDALTAYARPNGGDAAFDLGVVARELQGAVANLLNKVDFFNDVKDLVRNELATFETLFNETANAAGDKAAAFRTMLERFGAAHAALRQRIEGQNLSPDSRERSALYGALVTLGNLHAKASENLRLLAVPGQRARLAELKNELDALERNGCPKEFTAGVRSRFMVASTDNPEQHVLDENALMNGEFGNESIDAIAAEVQKLKAAHERLQGQIRTLTNLGIKLDNLVKGKSLPEELTLAVRAKFLKPDEKNPGKYVLNLDVLKNADDNDNLIAELKKQISENGLKNEYQEFKKHIDDHVDGAMQHLKDEVAKKLPEGLTDDLKDVLFLPIGKDQNVQKKSSPAEKKGEANPHSVFGDDDLLLVEQPVVKVSHRKVKGKAQQQSPKLEGDEFRDQHVSKCRGQALKDVAGGVDPKQVKMTSKTKIEDEYAQRCSEHAKKSIKDKLATLSNDLNNLSLKTKDVVLGNAEAVRKGDLDKLNKQLAFAQKNRDDIQGVINEVNTQIRALENEVAAQRPPQNQPQPSPQPPPAPEKKTGFFAGIAEFGGAVKKFFVGSKEGKPLMPQQPVPQPEVQIQAPPSDYTPQEKINFLQVQKTAAEQMLKVAKNDALKLETRIEAAKYQPTSDPTANNPGMKLLATALKQLKNDIAAFEKNMSFVGEADLASLARGWQAIEKKYGALLKLNAADLAKIEDPAELNGIDLNANISEDLKVKARFDLDDPAALAAHQLRRRQADFRAVLEKAQGLDENVRKDLLEKFDAWFDECGELPKALVELGEHQCAGAADLRTANRKILKFFNNYFACLADQAATNGTVEYGESGLPTLTTEAAVAAFVAKQKHVLANDLTLSAFGHADKIGCALKLLGGIKDPLAASLAEKITQAKALFVSDPSALKYGAEKYVDNYRALFRERLNKLMPNSDKTYRQFLTDMLEDIEDIRSTDDSEMRALVLDNCNQFAKTALELAVGLPEEARKKTVGDLEGKCKLLVRFFRKDEGGVDETLDPKRLKALFMEPMGLDEEGWAALTEKDVENMLPHLKFVLGQPHSRQYAAFLESVATKELPLSLLRRSTDKNQPQLKPYDNTALLHELVQMKVNSDLGIKDRDAKLDPDFMRGVGTISGKDILCGLAMDSLQELPYVPLKDEQGRLATVKALSLLWAMNGKKFGGLPELCQRVFGKGIAQLTEADCARARTQMRLNLFGNEKKPALTGLDPLLEIDPKNVTLKAVMNMLSGNMTNAFTTWKKVPNFAAVQGWIDGLRSLASGKTKAVDLMMGGVPVRFSTTAAGYTTAEFLDAKTKPPAATGRIMWIGQTPGALAASYADTALRDTLGNYKGADLQKLLPPAGDPAARDMALTVLTGRKFTLKKATFQVRAADLSDVSTADLLRMAKTALVKPGDVAAELLQKIATAPNRVNSQGILDVLGRLDAAEKDPAIDVDSIVRMPPSAAAGAASPEEAARQRAHGFVADLLASTESWKTDALDATARIRLAVTTHAAEVAELLQAGDENAINEKLATLGSKNLAAAAAKLLAGIKDKLGVNAPTAENLGAAFDAWNQTAKQTIEKQVGGKVEKTTVNGAFGVLAAAANADMEDLQKTFVDKVVNALISSGSGPIELQSLVEIAGAATINKNDKGYGEFLTNVLKNYFTGMGDFDKMRMLANVVRGTHAGTDEMDRLATLVKGAGPVFLKMVQGIPENAIPKDMVKLGKLLGDVKDKLPPMPDRVIKAQLLDMVMRSNKKILGIDVVKTLGAASVGQALLCRVRTAANPDGEECVIKLLRPDAQNAVRREMAFFKGEMAKVAGMDKTFQGRLDSILDELDLTKEATNVEFGQVYAVGGTGRVSSMELHSIIRPTESSMVVKKARGVTCDKYFRRVDEQMDEILKNLREEVEVDMPGGGKRKVVRYTAANMTEYNAQRDKLYKLYLQTLDRQRDLAEMTRRWADETLFGTGFFHGDLHAGNIMVDENGVTLIDYGNAIKPTDDQRNWLVMMLSLCSYGNHADFMKQLGTVPNDKWKGLAADLQVAFGKGTMNDSGLRIAAAVSILQRHGVEVPSILYNFSQSMLRLQSALNLANDTLLKLKAVFQDVGMKLDGMDSDDIEHEDPFDLRSSSIPVLFKSRVGAVHLKEMYKDNVDVAFDQGIKSTYDKLGDLCQSKDSIRTKLLPMLKKHAMFHTVSLSKNASPDSRDECGMRAYQLAEQMLDESFDLADKEMLRERLVKIANLIKERALAAFDNAQKLANASFPEFTSFSKIFYDCIDNNRKKITMIMIRFAFDKGKIEASLDVAENEQAAQTFQGSINKDFGLTHKAFSPVTIQKISALVRDEFMFSGKVFSAEWYKTNKGETAKQMARILLSNAVRVKQLLMREEGYKPEEDTGGIYLKQALDLAFGHYATQHGSVNQTLFELFRTANAEKYFNPWKAGFKNLDSVEQPGRKITANEQEMLTYVCDLFYTKDENSLDFIPKWKNAAKAA